MGWVPIILLSVCCSPRLFLPPLLPRASLPALCLHSTCPLPALCLPSAYTLRAPVLLLSKGLQRVQRGVSALTLMVYGSFHGGQSKHELNLLTGRYNNILKYTRDGCLLGQVLAAAVAPHQHQQQPRRSTSSISPSTTLRQYSFCTETECICAALRLCASMLH